MTTATQQSKDQTDNTAGDSGENQSDTSSRVAYVASKTERIAGALYALTRPFTPDEPLRERLRTGALSLISAAHTLREGAADEDTPSSLPTVLRRIKSQLSVAKNGGLISAMNHQVLTEEITRFAGEVEEFAAVPGPHLDNSYFGGNMPALEAGSEDEKPDHTSGRNTPSGSSSSVSGGGEDDSSSSAPSQTKQKPKKLSAKDKRRKKILALFDESEEITVNDVTEVVNGYSTKTVQRDLKALVKNGQLEKHGKRRWTSYTKA